MSAQGAGRAKLPHASPLALTVLVFNSLALLYLLVFTTLSLLYITFLLSRGLPPSCPPHGPGKALQQKWDRWGAAAGPNETLLQDGDPEENPVPPLLESTGALTLQSPSREELVAAEKLYQQNLRKRRKYYGKNWERKLEVMAAKHLKPSTISSAFVLEMFAPNYPCFREERIGHWSDGGKWVCRPSMLNSSSVVYSIGSNGEDTFETELYRRAGCQIHVFDHTVKKALQAVVEKKASYRFHNLGIAVQSDPAAKLLSLQDMMRRLGHDRLDVFKIDCEGCEYDVMPAVFRAFERPPFDQVQVEVHYIKDRKRLARLLATMEENGFRMFHLEMNWRAMDCVELAYIHESLCRP